MLVNKYSIVAISLIAALLITGCSATNSDNPTPSDVTLQFANKGSTATKSKVGYSANGLQMNDALSIQGSNGTLVITDLRFIVEDFELERVDSECEDLEGNEEDECEEFKSEPFFVDLPLTADTLNLNTSAIEPGLYEELEFEIDDLDLSEEADEDQEGKQLLAELVRSEFPNWPDEASMVIIGNFISDQGDTTAFTTYAEAELEIEMEFSPPLEVTDNSISKLLRININPVNWFLRTDGTVFVLSDYDYSTTGNILEFEVEIENGFEEIEIDDDDD